MMASLSPRRRRWLTGWLAAALLAVPLAAVLSAAFGEQQALDRIAAAGDARTGLYRAYLEGRLERPAGVPLALASDATVVAAAGGDGRAAGRLNAGLAALAAAAGISDLYVMDGGGTTVAANNYDSATSFVGRNFAFRPYFTAAMRGETGRAFALGATSHQPGYYVAQPVRRGEAVIGAVVAKVVLDRLDALPAGNPEKVMVTDPDGIVFITDTPAWRFHSLESLTPDRLAAIEREQRYPGVTILPIPGRLGDRLALVDGVRYQVSSLELPGELPGSGWRLHVLQDTRAAEDAALVWGTAGGFAAVALMLALYGVARHRRLVRHEQQRGRQERDELERRVRERTAELIQAAKLATIGEMAAGMVHEVNQPLAAIRAFAENAVQFLDRGRLDRTRANLGEIAVLVDRLAGITRSLKGFARRPAERLDAVDLAASVDKALALVGQRLRGQGVELAVEIPTLAVQAEDVRMQQVLVNLIANALDALQDAARPALSVAAWPEGERVVLRVADTGPGIAEAVLPRLFDPFFTTKPAGEGLGLGLSIASAIVRDFGGTLTAGNRPDGGAEFTLTLKRVEQR
jgi:two-component system, NtrC family, C4-dicarboxylate transport sensor histidine kinase DctB